MSKKHRKGPSKQQRREMKQKAEYRIQNAELISIVDQLGTMLTKSTEVAPILRDPRVPKYLNSEELKLFVAASEVMGKSLHAFAERHKAFSERAIANSKALRDTGAMNQEELQQLYFIANDLITFYNDNIGQALTIITNTAQYVTDCEEGKAVPTPEPTEESAESVAEDAVEEEAVSGDVPEQVQ